MMKRYQGLNINNYTWVLANIHILVPLVEIESDDGSTPIVYRKTSQQKRIEMFKRSKRQKKHKEKKLRLRIRPGKSYLLEENGGRNVFEGQVVQAFFNWFARYAKENENFRMVCLILNQNNINDQMLPQYLKNGFLFRFPGQEEEETFKLAFLGQNAKTGKVYLVNTEVYNVIEKLHHSLGDFGEITRCSLLSGTGIGGIESKFFRILTAECGIASVKSKESVIKLMGRGLAYPFHNGFGIVRKSYIQALESKQQLYPVENILIQKQRRFSAETIFGAELIEDLDSNEEGLMTLLYSIQEEELWKLRSMLPGELVKFLSMYQQKHADIEDEEVDEFSFSAASFLDKLESLDVKQNIIEHFYGMPYVSTGITPQFKKVLLQTIFACIGTAYQGLAVPVLQRKEYAEMSLVVPTGYPDLVDNMDIMCWRNPYINGKTMQVVNVVQRDEQSTYLTNLECIQYRLFNRSGFISKGVLGLAPDELFDEFEIRTPNGSISGKYVDIIHNNGDVKLGRVSDPIAKYNIEGVLMVTSYYAKGNNFGVPLISL